MSKFENKLVVAIITISLGSNKEVNDNFISAEAAVLDQIQAENDIIFVVAGTNTPNENIEKIGSTADSINSVVVNAVTKSGLSTKYTRKGLAPVSYTHLITTKNIYNRSITICEKEK